MSALKEKILKRIASAGPLSVAGYMALVLTDPEHGYYTTRDPLGAKGDFITAPEVSQIFGELIGLWFVQAWEDRGQPKRFHFAELGPGRGTLMADACRAATIRPEFLKAAEVTLVETSPVLRKKQKAILNGSGVSVAWSENLLPLPDKPLFLMANEFLDALPILQFVKTRLGWRERKLGAQHDKLFFLAGDAAMDQFIPTAFQGSPIDSIFEISPEAKKIVGEIAAHIVRHGGAALFIDYGHEHSALGDTFQAVKAHTHADPLIEPGQADLTAHVDFEALSAAAKAAGNLVFGPVAQGAFLEALGIHVRAATLKHKADAATRAGIDAAVDRLTKPAQMGTLFKVMALAAPNTPPLPGFPC